MKTGIPRSIKVLLLASLLSSCFLDYGAYRASYLLDPAAVSPVLRGTADAPQQYRIGIVWMATWLDRHVHLGTHRYYALIDTASLLLTAMLLLKVLERTQIYSSASRTLQWFGAAAAAVLFQFYLAWLLFLQRAETLPTAMFLALALWLWQVDSSPRRIPRSFAIATALVALAFLQSLIRADVPCLLNAGIFAVALTPLGKKLSIPRTLAAITTFVSAAIAAGVQLYMAKIAYPHATYGRVKMWQLRPNFVHGLRWIPFLLFMLPLLWMAVQVARRRFTSDAPGIAFLAGALGYAAVWFTIGKIDEVRIFIPFALALIPLTVQMAMLRAADAGLAREPGKPSSAH